MIQFPAIQVISPIEGQLEIDQFHSCLILQQLNRSTLKNQVHFY